MCEIYNSVNQNNKILDALKPCKVSFECKQKRLSELKFWNFYENASKHERMRCLLCVSGLKHVPKPFEGA